MLTVCKMCLDIIDPITDDGIYIVVKNDRYRGIVVKDGKRIFDNTYMRSHHTLEEVLTDVERYI